MLRDVLFVMGGGAVGSALRYLTGVMLPVAAGTFPWPTFVVNVFGSFILGVIATAATHHDVLSRQQALLLGTGLCGGFTTFSTFSVESVALFEQDRLDLAALYIGLTLVCTLGAAWFGMITARSLIN
jgi:CrcB protein